MPTVAYHTLGCKVNQYETEKTREALESAGFATVSFGSAADAYIINTCAVTEAADSKSRTAVRRALRLNPDAFVVVTGCYSQLEPARVRAIEGVDLIVPNEEKELAPERVIARFARPSPPAPLPRRERGAAPSPPAPLPHRERGAVRPRVRTRAVVKVQDGCDHFCSYCIVPFARPRKYSRKIEDVTAEIEALAAFGYAEVVLTGIRLGAYADGDARLPQLVLRAAQVDGIRRIRLSSVEPWEVDDALLDVLTHPKVCRHLHIPLQSGDDRILAAMNRPYSARGYLGLIERVRARIDGVGITTDVIAGFPGETDQSHENTCGVVRQAGFSRLHVFRYSPRKRTRACSLPAQIDSATKRRRAEELSELGRMAVMEFAGRFVGTVLDVLVEGRSRGTNQLMGFADNYVRVHLDPADSVVSGEIVRVRVTGVDQDGNACGCIEDWRR